MKGWSLRTRLALAIGLAVTVLWLIAALATANRLSHRMDAVLDDHLQTTAQRILPLALHDLRGREDRGDDDHEEKGDDDHEIDRLPDDEDGVAYQVRDDQGRILLQSRDAGRLDLPAFQGNGFAVVQGLRIYQDSAADGRVTITVAEPLDARASLARSMMVDLSLPLLVVIPLSLLAIALVLRRGFAPLQTLRASLARRGAQDLSPLPVTGLPAEIRPFAEAVNDLLTRLLAAFEAERSFAANAAHELRTPVAGAIAQAQRLQAETPGTPAARRAAEIETTLKRLMRTSEKLMQLARAEGGRMRADVASDMRPVLRLIVDDFRRAGATARCDLTLPPDPVPALIEPDALGILARNLIENALRHGLPDTPVQVALSADGVLTVANDGPALPAESLARLTHRFQKGAADGEGAGLGLAIVTAITDRAGASFRLISPRPGHDSGVLAEVVLPRG